ncbi:MAG: molybdopterin-guanine dinucleotide biosynthesis protein B [Candidatus Schmidhempelia sp.]|nr:molybdopterin-guanine dinucleotide biosynthesis protein B [Candidatus Schmidhempelia sp.]
MKLLAICGYSGSGKTTLLKKLIPLLKAEGVKIGVIKHTHHNVDIDKPGKDSYELRKAGAEQTIIANQHRWALMVETPTQTSLNITQLADQFTSVDLVLIEGFKQASIDKLIVHRQIVDKLLTTDNKTLAIISDIDPKIQLPFIHIDDINTIKSFILHWLTK